jgi:hypothetical protein
MRTRARPLSKMKIAVMVRHWTLVISCGAVVWFGSSAPTSFASCAVCRRCTVLKSKCVAHTLQANAAACSRVTSPMEWQQIISTASSMHTNGVVAVPTLSDCDSENFLSGS